MLQILKRPRGKDNKHLKMFESIKNKLKKVSESDYISTIQEILEEYNETNNESYFFHVNKYNIVILDENKEEIIMFRKPDE